MAISFREQPWFVQALLYVFLAGGLIVAAWYIPYSPLSTERAKLEQLKSERDKLQGEVTRLEVVKRRHAEFQTEMKALERQLETLKAIVPEEKEVDELMRMIQQSAIASNVAVRRLTAKPVVPREFHAELPFEVEVDGRYFAIQDFFARLARLSRIINIGDVNFSTITDQRAKKYQAKAGTTVTGTLVVTTFFTKGVEPPPAKPARGKAAAKKAAPKQAPKK